jgi:exopolysaccharide biosynthesis WecB/TagA/CpsF family protein
VSAVLVTLLVLGVVTACAASYLLLLAVAALFHRPSRRPGEVRARLAVLVPAHDEEALIARCVRSLQEQSYPRDLYDIVVIADNCSDDTALVAMAAGASLLVRDEPDSRGKGQALRWAMDRLLVERPNLDAFVVVDADSVAGPELLSALVARLEAGAEVAQAEYLSLPEGEVSARDELGSAALLLFHRVRFAGRAVLGLPCQLVGNGMLFSRAVLERHPWSAFTSAEDLEYSIDLRLAGVRPAFAADGGVRGPMPSGGRAARTQRLRWEGGRFHVARTRLPRLLRAIVTKGRLDLVDAAIDLAVPPLGILAAALLVGAGTSALVAGLGCASMLLLTPWLVGLAALTLFVLVGLAAAGAPASMYRALVLAPGFVVRTLLTRLRLVRGLRATTWERTERPGDGAPEQATPLEIITAIASGGDGEPVDSTELARSPLYVEPEPRGLDDDRPARRSIVGVPIDLVDVDDAAGKVLHAIERRRFAQVCTVNLDFLVHSRKDEHVHRILATSDLNVADGAPVLWLLRMLGHRLPARVAGADLVPHLLAGAAGTRVFLLGGEDGTAEKAAQELSARFPSVVIAGVYEPPRASLDAMDHAEILRRVNDARPDLLLVALGHPKQEKWIDAHRDQLPGCVAIGVGCTFDLLAGRRRRAPVWMQQHGLEWLYRMLREPRRLASRYLSDAAWLLVILIPLVLQQRLLARGPAGLGRASRSSGLTK